MVPSLCSILERSFVSPLAEGLASSGRADFRIACQKIWLKLIANCYWVGPQRSRGVQNGSGERLALVLEEGEPPAQGGVTVVCHGFRNTKDSFTPRVVADHVVRSGRNVVRPTILARIPWTQRNRDVLSHQTSIRAIVWEIGMITRLTKVTGRPTTVALDKIVSRGREVP